MEPERPIEKLLRDWAKRRREETKAPPELHPATRRMLQGEVARKFSQTARPSRSFSAWLIAFWPRVAWGLGVFAVLAVAVWLVMPPLGGGSNTTRLANGETTRGYQEEFKRQPTPQVNEPASAPTDEVQLSRPDVRAENQSLPGNLSDRKLASGAGVRPPEPAVTDKDALVFKAPAAPPTMTDANRAQNGELTYKARASGGPAQSAPSVSGDTERARDVAQSTTSSLQPIGPGGAGETRAMQAPSSPSRPMVSTEPSSASPPVSTDGAQSSRSAAVKSRYGLASANSRTDSSATVAISPAPSASVETVLAGEGRNVRATGQSTSAPSGNALAAAAPSAAAPNFFYADGAKTDTGRQVQRFARIETETKAKALILDTAASSRTFLASFELQQVGNEVRILDHDGSVYTGYVQPAVLRSRVAASAKEEATGGARAYRSVNGAETPAPSLEAESATAQNYSFRVSGTNRSLNVPVVFTGSVVTGEALAVNAVTNAVALRGVLREKNQFAPNPKTNTTNLRISGHAVLGGREELEIKAVTK